MPSPVNSLKSHINGWRNIKANDNVLDWIENGVKLPFNNIPDKVAYENHSFTSTQRHFVKAEIQKLLSTGAISKVNNVPHCVNPLGCVPKKDNKWRLIVDLRFVNKHITCPYYKNEGIDVVCDSLENNDSFVSIDLKDGFHHINIHRDFRTFLGFKFDNQYYVWNVLVFGLNVSPYFFSKVIKEFVTYLRAQALRFSMFVDDGLLRAKPDIIASHKELLLDTCHDLGLVINWDKSVLDPSNSITYIGYVISTNSRNGIPWIKIPSNRINKLKRDIARALKNGSVKARFLARICGQLISFTKAILPTKLLLRNLYSDLKLRVDWSSTIVLSEPARKDLLWWQSAIRDWNGRPIEKRTIEAQVSTDASNSGWGASYGNLKASGLWTNREKYLHINEKELLAVLLALHSFKAQLTGKHIQILSDNITTVAYINHLGGTSVLLNKIATNIWMYCYEIQVSLEAKHLSGVLNVEADRLSRLESTYSWTMHPAIFRMVDKLWGPHTVDRFADVNNHLLPIYNSQFFDPKTSGVDALAQQNWGSENNFVNPPFALIPQVLKVISAQKAQATIIAPMWKSKLWMNTLVSLSDQAPLKLPASSLWWIRGKRPEPLKNRKWRLYAWRVNGKNV